MLFQIPAISQNVYFTRTGQIYFLSHTEAIDIDANNHQAASFLDIVTGKMQFAVLIKSFEFTLATAKEHFNESYMESDKYPKAEFKGEIQNIDNFNLNNQGAYQVKVKGEIVIREIKKNIEVDAEIIVSDKVITAKSEFYLAISDFNIKVPKLLDHRVAKQILVKVNINYVLYQN
ncbi:YceI family protein [Bacteroidota bacterium]